MKTLHQAIQTAFDKVAHIQGQMSRCDAAIQAAEAAAHELATLRKQKATSQAEAFLAEKPTDTTGLDEQIKAAEAELDRLSVAAEAARAAREILAGNIQAAQDEHEAAKQSLKLARHHALVDEVGNAKEAYEQALRDLRRHLAHIEAAATLANNFAPHPITSGGGYALNLRNHLHQHGLVNTQLNIVGWIRDDSDGVADARADLIDRLQLDA